MTAGASNRNEPRRGNLSRRALCAALGAELTAACAARSDLSKGRQTVTLWFSYGGKNRETLESLVTAFNHSQSSVFLRAIYQGDYYEGLAKLRVALAAHRAPALSHVVGEIVPYLSEAGLLEPLARYPGASELPIVPELGQAGSFRTGAERELVTLPFNRSTPIAYLNGALFAEAGLRAPETWAELREVARRLTRRRGNRTSVYGLGCPVDSWFWTALMEQAGGELVEPNGDVSLGGEAGVSALQFWRDLVHTDGSMKPPPGRDYNAWEQTNQDFLSGRVAMMWSSTAFVSYLEENARFPVVAAPLPGLRRRAVPTGGTHWVILRQAPAEEKAAAFRVLHFMLQTDPAIFWATHTGYIPVTISAIRTLEARGHYRTHPNQRVAIDQLRYALPWPWWPKLFRLQREVVQPRLERAVLGPERPERVLDEARALAREL
jgi:sn-glycerol 3-phosphate transport system substrate-binding protein